MFLDKSHEKKGLYFLAFNLTCQMALLCFHVLQGTATTASTQKPFLQSEQRPAGCRSDERTPKVFRKVRKISLSIDFMTFTYHFTNPTGMHWFPPAPDHTTMVFTSPGGTLCHKWKFLICLFP